MSRFLFCMIIFSFLFACGKDETPTPTSENNLVQSLEIDSKADKNKFSSTLLAKEVIDPAHFYHKFNKFNASEKYYFCAAFTMGAMSVSKPITASAMVRYFIGLGVVDTNEGINKSTYKAFDYGKNVFRNEAVVNLILQKKICEKIIGQASQRIKKKQINTKEINDIGFAEIRKLVNFIQNDK